MDGTFHQTGPIERLQMKDQDYVFSYDLKSATDRWPVSLMHDVLSCMFGPSTANSIVNGTLALNTFYVGPPAFKVQCPSNICFGAGQPLGYYGSWAIFSLSHHFCVWMAGGEKGRPRPG
ncbi:MAG: hypothetical protein EOP45_18930 [Sphingobacteriaceae bacterium]|nr:MAG: hypothetical protein EOP45_18930 [Sphingobacteriaceae bacterium]